LCLHVNTDSILNLIRGDVDEDCSASYTGDHKERDQEQSVEDQCHLAPLALVQSVVLRQPVVLVQVTADLFHLRQQFTQHSVGVATVDHIDLNKIQIQKIFKCFLSFLPK